MAQTERTKEELLGEIALLQKRITDFARIDAERKRAAEVLLERAKELDCIYVISNLIEREDSLEKIFQGSADIIPNAWLYPDIACARITFKEEKYQTGNFRETNWRQSASIKVNGQPAGAIELCYLEERPVRDEGPFSREERKLIDAIAERLGRVAERKEAEKKVKRTGEEWQRTFDAISDSIFILDRENTICRVNKVFLDIFGLKEGQVIGKKCYEVVHKSDKPWIMCPHSQTMKDHKAHTEEVDDPVLGIPLLVSTSPIFDEKGELAGSVHIAKDISERKRTEKALKQKMEELERFNKVAVGRELKMIELKEKLKALEEGKK